MTWHPDAERERAGPEVLLSVDVVVVFVSVPFVVFVSVPLCCGRIIVHLGLAAFVCAIVVAQL